MAARYTVETDNIPEALHDDDGPMLVAWIKDHQHPSGRPAAISWHAAEDDAAWVCAALNRDYETIGFGRR